jgi:hypothetical protein
MMDDVDPRLDRLLRSAARAQENSSPEMPFGFETRVIALWRAGQSGNGNGLMRFVRRIALAAVTVIALATAATVYEFNQDRDVDESLVIADSAIQSEFSP